MAGELKNATLMKGVVCPTCGAGFDDSVLKGDGELLIGCTGCNNPFIVVNAQGVRSSHACDAPLLGDLAPAGSVMAGVLSALPDAVNHLPVLPEVPQRILALVHDPMSSMKDCAELIHQEPVIAMRLLRIANSALYGGTSEITDVQIACARLGLKTVTKVVSTIAQESLYSGGSPKQRPYMRKLWRHALTTAYCADLLADRISEQNRDTAFLGGLIHDIGKVVLIDLIFNRYHGTVGRLSDDSDLLIRTLDRFHSFAGLRVVRHWGMRPEYAYTTFFCNQPELTESTPWFTLTHLVSFASALSEACGHGLSGTLGDDVSLHPSAAALGISPDNAVVLHATLAVELDKAVEAWGAG